MRESRMTEQEWLASKNPWIMLLTLKLLNRSPRKLRLFACAVARLIWDHLEEDLRKVVELAERLADGLATEKERADASRNVYDNPWSIMMSTLQVLQADPYVACGNMCSRGWAERAAVEANLLRDIFGNPFRLVIVNTGPHSLQVPPGNLLFDIRWRTPTAISIAEAIYQDRDWEGLPYLGDALEDAGCPLEVLSLCQECSGSGVIEVKTFSAHANDPGVILGCLCCGGYGAREGSGKALATHPILAHLRSDGPHTRGCWALDLVLGKE